MRLAALTGVYVGVVCSAQIGAQKIVELPLTGDGAPGGTYLVGLALALIELAHLTAPSRAEGFRNAQVMVAAGFAGSALLAGYIALIDAHAPADELFAQLNDTWRIVLGSLVAFLVSQTVDNGIGAWLRGRVHDAVRVLVSNAVSAPLDSAVFLLVAFGSLQFLGGQIQAKYAATLVLGLPLVLLLRRAVAGGAAVQAA